MYKQVFHVDSFGLALWVRGDQPVLAHALICLFAGEWEKKQYVIVAVTTRRSEIGDRN